MTHGRGSSRFGSTARALLFIFLLPRGASAAEDVASLEKGQSVVLSRADGSAILATPADEQLLGLVEVAGADVVARVTPMDRAGGDAGSGHVIVLAPREKRSIRVRDTLAPSALDKARLRVEVLQGAGRLTIVTSNVGGLRVQAAASTRRRAVGHPGRSPSSITLIDRAEASGTLDGETALLYRVYALFADARLPEQYRGDDSVIRDSLYLGEVRDKFATLSAATQAAVEPFLIPPAYEGSWAKDRPSPVKVSGTSPRCKIFKDNWESVSAAGGLVLVWHRIDDVLGPVDRQRARNLASEIDSRIWPALSGLMAPHLPPPDDKQDCGGADAALDIYLTDIARSMYVPYYVCPASEGFILLQRTAPYIEATHEIFHAFQWSIPRGGCISGLFNRWWIEGTATWSEEFVYPEAKPNFDLAKVFLDAPAVSLDSSDEPHTYSSYMFPFYLYRIAHEEPRFVRTAFEQWTSGPAVDAVDKVVPGGLETAWPKFAKANWNFEPVDDYAQYNGLGYSAKPETGGPITLASNQARSIPISLSRLSATYKHFKFTDETSTVTFWNGATFELVLENVPGLGLEYRTNPVSPDKIKGASVQALIKLRGKDDWQEEDWSGREQVSYCRDVVSQRIDELVLIVSNSDFADSSRKLEPPGLAPILETSNIGCHKWTGTVTFTDAGLGLTLTTNVTLEREPHFHGRWIGSGKHAWTFSGPCTGSGSRDLIPSTAAVLVDFAPLGTDGYRSYFANGGILAPITVTCAGSSGPYTVTSWWKMPPSPRLTPNLPGRYLLVQDSGRVIDDSYEPFLKWSWHLTAEKEP
jgi:hypothetical protein